MIAFSGVINNRLTALPRYILKNPSDLNVFFAQSNLHKKAITIIDQPLSCVIHAVIEFDIALLVLKTGFNEIDWIDTRHTDDASDTTVENFG